MQKEAVATNKNSKNNSPQMHVISHFLLNDFIRFFIYFYIGFLSCVSYSIYLMLYFAYTGC